jgi:hypothetical protein
MVPQVGIFWFIQQPGGFPVILVSGVRLEEAERYGEYLNYPGDHSRLWPGIKQHLTSFFHDCDYRDWPRGRVIYNIRTRCFEIYLNDQLRTPEFEAEILANFNLPKAETTFATDPHYIFALYTLVAEGTL